MKALRFHEPGKVAVEQVPDPEPGPGEAILAIHATGLCNSDVRVYLGEKHAAPGVIPGHEMAGEVVAIGPGVDLETGQAVAVCPILCCGRCTFCRAGFRNRCPYRQTLGYDLDGGIAEYVRIPAQLVAMGHLLPVDPTAPPDIRAYVEPLACVLHSVESMGVHPGEPFAIVGGGPMGLTHLAVARFYNAGPVLVVEPDATRRAVALELGADAAVTPEEAKDIAMDLTGGLGFPAVAMAVGFADALPTCLDIVRRMGWINMFAGFPPGSSFDLDLNRIHYEEVRIFGTQNAPFHLFARAAEIVHRIEGIHRIITNRYPLADAAEAYSARLERSGLKSAVIVRE